MSIHKDPGRDAGQGVSLASGHNFVSVHVVELNGDVEALLQEPEHLLTEERQENLVELHGFYSGIVALHGLL